MAEPGPEGTMPAEKASTEDEIKPDPSNPGHFIAMKEDRKDFPEGNPESGLPKEQGK